MKKTRLSSPTRTFLRFAGKKGLVNKLSLLRFGVSSAKIKQLVKLGELVPTKDPWTGLPAYKLGGYDNC